MVIIPPTEHKLDFMPWALRMAVATWNGMKNTADIHYCTDLSKWDMEAPEYQPHAVLQPRSSPTQRPQIEKRKALIPSAPRSIMVIRPEADVPPGMCSPPSRHPD